VSPDRRPHLIRIATYNIHKGRGLDGRVRIARILRVLQEIDADIIALQEVVDMTKHRGAQGAPGDPGDPGDNEKHQARFLADELGYACRVGETRKHRLGIMSNTTLTRWKIESSRHIDLTVAGRQPRGALRTDIRIGNQLLHVFNVHLGTAVRERRAQARLIDERLLTLIDVPGQRIVLGDFNDWNHGLVTRTLSKEFHLTDLAAHLPRTRAYPALLPFLHLDHIYLDHQLKIEKACFHRNRRSLIASDHLPLVVDLSLR
jgi:endonuclease/exonuclease/phosphatase family metal-dependent hydrolase